MKKRLGLLLFWLCCLPLWAVAQSPVTGFCEKGGQAVVTNGVSSTTKVQRTYTGCTVSVFDAGSTNLSTIFSDALGTPKANPFTADATTGYWNFFCNNGSYDVSITASGLSATTIRTVKIADASSSPLSGSGTSGRVPKWSGTSSITNSQITDNATSVGINNTSPAASALLDLTSTARGLLPPRMTQAQRDAISSPAAGLMIYNLDTSQLNLFTTSWGTISGGGSGITSLNGLTGASQLFATVNDTNITLAESSAAVTHTFTVGWSGTLAKTRTLGTTVYTDQGNTFSAGAQDFSAAATFTIPVTGGSNPTVSGRLAYDSTSNTFEYGANGVNRTVVNLSESQTLSNKTLSAPNIGDFTGAQHSHQNAAGGGLLDVAAIGSGVFSLARGGTNTTSASYSTNGAFYYDGSKFITTAAGGAGTLCLQATDGGVPTFGACSGTAATSLSALTAATTSNTLNSGDNAQIWKWTLTTSGKTGWRISENTASAAAGTPLLVAIDTLSTSTVNPFQVTAGGTANGVRVDTTGKLAKIGTGSVTADALNGLSTNGWLVQTSTGVFTARTFAAGTGIAITNLDGTGGNPSFSVDQTTNFTLTGTDTFTQKLQLGSNATENETAWSSLGASPTSIGVTDSSSSSSTTSANPQSVMQTWRSGNNNAFGHLNAVYKTAGTGDTYGSIALVEDLRNYSGFAAGDYNNHGVRGYVFLSPTNVGAGVNVFGYNLLQTHRIISGIRAVGAQIEAGNFGSNADTDATTQDSTLGIVVAGIGTAHNSVGVLFESAVASAWATGIRTVADSIYKYGFDFKGLYFHPQGTAAATQTSTAIVGTSSIWLTELTIGDQISYDGATWYTVTAITNNTNATISPAYAGTTTSGVTLVKTVAPFRMSPESYFLARNLADTADYRVLGVKSDTVRLDSDGKTIFAGSSALQLTTAAGNVLVNYARITLALSNGLNSNISIGTANFARAGGPTGAYSVGGFTNGIDGKVLVFINIVGQTLTIVNEDGSSTAANRIATLTGGNVTLRAGAQSSATFIYSGSDSRWLLTATN